jgi:cell division protein DivIC
MAYTTGDRKRRKRKKRYRINRVRMTMSVLILIVIVYFGVQIRNVVKLREEQAALKSQNKKLTQEVEDMNDELKEIDDKNYIEKRARLELKMIKPGETLFIIDNGDDSSDSSSGN